MWTLTHMCIYPCRRLLSELEVDASPLEPLPSSVTPTPPTVVEDAWNSRQHKPPVVSAGPPPLEETGFEYPLEPVSVIENTFGSEARQFVHIIAGSRRSLIYCTPTNSRDASPPITDIEAVSDLGPWPDPDPRWPHDAVRREAAWEETEMVTEHIAAERMRAGPVFGLVAIGPQAWGEMGHGVACIAWEEWSGRMVIVPKHVSHYMQVYDFARIPKEGECLSLFFHNSVFMLLT